MCQSIKRLGGTVLEDVNEAHLATHIIASEKGNSMRRTPKLMIGMCHTGNIVSVDWLTESCKAKQVLPADNFLLVNDKKFEKKCNFEMRSALESSAELRKKGKKVLSGWSVHVCKGVAGEKAPPEQEMKLIVEHAGGVWTPSLSQKKLADVDLSKIVIITSDPEVQKQASVKPVKNVLDKGAKKATTSWLFDTLMRQEVKFD